MPTSNLTRIQYTQLDTVTWCMTAQVSESLNHLSASILWDRSLWLSLYKTSQTDLITFNRMLWHYRVMQPPSARTLAHRQRQQQRQGVRQLLQELLKKLSVNDTLDESGFPYRLVNSQYYVCFSHTGANHSKHTTKSNQTTGQNLPSKIAVVISRQRPAGIDIESNNIAWHVVRRFYSANEIALLEQLSTEQRDNTAKLLWQIKESFIKINQYTLAQGLGMDYSTLIPSLIEDDKKSLSFSISNETKKTRHRSAYRVATLHAQETVVVF